MGSWYILIYLNIFAKLYILDVWQGSKNAKVLKMPRLYTVTNVPKYGREMPKYA